MNDNKFQNVPSKKLYEFFMEKMDKKELTRQQIADALEVYQSNPGSYFHSLRTGHMSIKLDHILKAQEAFGLDPCFLFHEEGEVGATTPTVSMQISELLSVIKSQQQTINSLVSNTGNAERRKNA